MSIILVLSLPRHRQGHTPEVEKYIYFLIVCVDALSASQQFFSHVGMFPGLNQ